MSQPNVNSRDFRRQVWVQTTREDFEPRMGAIFSLSNGRLGLRGCHEEMPRWGRSEFYIAGTYTGGPPSLLGFHDADHILTHPQRLAQELHKGPSGDAISTLPNFPNPVGVSLRVGGEAFSHEKTKVLSNERLLETDGASMRRRLVFRDDAGNKTRVDSRRFVSFADRRLICLRYAVTPLNHRLAVEVEGFIHAAAANPNGVVLWRDERWVRRERLQAVQCVTPDGKVRVAIAQQSAVRTDGDSTVLELFVIAGQMELDEAIEAAAAAAKSGFDQCLADHLRCYQQEADGGRVDFDGEASALQGFNFGQLHLNMAWGPDSARVGVPIKGLTGHGYRFMNFWDTDFHMFPYFLITRPREARRLLEYRYNQLDAYRQNARAWGAAGAQVPWETDASGREQTAPWLCLGDREIHISADAAYMFKLYDDLADDHDALVTMGAEFIFETARFYRSRIKRVAARGRWELPDVGCPDQYHTFADNNVFISRMAQWNLQYAVELSQARSLAAAAAKVGLQEAEVDQWREILANFYIIVPDADGIIEEFDGFFQLSTDLDGVCETFCAHSQAVKQPDVLGAFGPFEDLYPLELRRKNWQYYARRTLHGSSLSLPGMALAAGRCGLNDEALLYLDRAARIDLDDINLDAERGVHVSSYAVQWQAVVFGFGGLTPRRGSLHFRPNLPRQWRFLNFTVHWKFQRLRVRLKADEIVFDADEANTRPVAIRLCNQPVMNLQPGKTVPCTWTRGF